MPQSIFVQVGQCGNQVGHRFWELALQEYHHHKKFVSDMSNFFKISDTRSDCGVLESIKARAILVDMEEGVISSALRGPLQHLFSRTQLVTDVSGSGNNWAVGNKFYGLKYRKQLIELCRREAEECDSLQCFLLMHSMGGGTGSGLGTAIVEYLYDEFPKVPRFVFAAFPSIQDDVITSPYNAVLANNQLINFADCVIPFENKALIDLCNKLPVSGSSLSPLNQSSSKMKHFKRKPYLNMPVSPKKTKPFDEMNDIIAKVILNLTCSSRFPGSLNVDINEIVVNMTPYPRLHYLIPNLSPLTSAGKSMVDQIFSDAFSPTHRLFQCYSPQSVLLASAILCRGLVPLSDVQMYIEKFKRNCKFVSWNEDGWKIGLCDIPQIGCPYSVLMLQNTSAIAKPFSTLKERCLKMYKKKAHLHHFLEIEDMDTDIVKSSLHHLDELIEEYKSMEQASNFPELPRLKVLL